MNDDLHNSSEPVADTSPTLAQMFHTPNNYDSNHIGPIIAETPTGFIQQVAQDRFILHNKEMLQATSPALINAVRTLAQNNLFANIGYQKGRANLSPISTSLANTTDGVYRGELFFATPTEYHQRISLNHYITHDRKLIDHQLEQQEMLKPWREAFHNPAAIEPGTRFSVTYQNGRIYGKVWVTTPDKQHAEERSNAR